MRRFSRSFPILLCGVDLGCCVPPFAVGDQVDWTLIFVSPGPDHPLVLDDDDPGLLTRRWRLERSGAGLLVIDDPLVVSWAPHITPIPRPGEVDLSGILVAIFHGGLGDAVDPPPRVQGVVRRIRVVTRLQQQQAPQVLRWVPSSTWTYDVSSSATTLNSRPPVGKVASRRVDTGLLVDLQVPVAPRDRRRSLLGRRDGVGPGGTRRRPLVVSR